MAMPIKIAQNGMISVPFTSTDQQQVYYNTSQQNFQMNPMSKEFHLQTLTDQFESKKSNSAENSTHLSNSSYNSGSIRTQNVGLKTYNNIENIPPHDKTLE